MTGRRTLRDAAGRAVVTFTASARDGLPAADELTAAPGFAPDAVADLVMRRLPGHIVETTAPLGERLLCAGATLRRRSTLMTCDTAAPRTPVPMTAGILVGPAQGVPPDALLDAYIKAFPPEHPDHHAGVDRDGQRELLRSMMDGEVIGPLLPCARTAAAGGRLVGAALVVDMPGAPPLGGPWVGELFRHPDAPAGTGAAMLAAALDRAAADGLPHVGLRVSTDNPARRIYDALGFTETRSSVSVVLPG